MKAGLAVLGCFQSTLCFPTVMQQSLMLAMSAVQKTNFEGMEITLSPFLLEMDG